MASSVVIHLLRPYANEEEYLAHESSSIGQKSMLLIDQPSLPADTTVVFEVSLLNGQKPIRAEGRVIAHQAPEYGQPGGLRVRFKRFGPATKAFIQRAAAASGESVASGPLEANLPAPSLAPSSAGAPVLRASGVHERVTPKVVAAPEQRDALLARLRARRAG